MNIADLIRDEIAAIPVDTGERGLSDVRRLARRRARRRRGIAGVAATAGIAGVVVAVAVVAVVAGGATLDRLPLGSPDQGTVVATDSQERAYITVAGTDGSVRYIPEGRRVDPVTISGTTLDGSVLSTKDLRGGIVLIRYWAEWCKACTDDALIRAGSRPQPGTTVVGAVLQAKSRTDQAADFAREHDFAFQSIVDGIGGVPATVALDATGRVTAVKLGTFTTETDLAEFIDLAS